MTDFKGYVSRGMGLFVIFLMAISVPASSAYAIAEIEDNNTFESRQILPFGTTRVEGELQLDVLYAFEGNLTEGLVDSFSITEGLSANDPFYAWTNTVPSGIAVDTVLGLFRSDGSMIDSNDDGGPLEGFYGSGINGTVNDDGTIHMQVTGYGDSDFTGSHSESGEYFLYVADEFMHGDNDFFSFTGLLPGSAFTAGITSDDDQLDTMLGWYNSDGSLIDYDDDGAGGLLSRMEGVVPASGNLNLLVTGYPYFDEDWGDHSNRGVYSLELTAAVVPEPVSSVLFIVGGAALGFRKLRTR